MISKLILDKLIPLPTEDELLEQLKAELVNAQFPITYFKSGGIFYTLLRVFIRLKLEFLVLARTMLSNLVVSSAEDVDWLELRAADFGKARKAAVKTQGNITLSRSITTAAVTIAKGCVFKTDVDANGNELRFVSTQSVVFAIGATALAVPVEAEFPGKDYNVPAGKITRCLIHLESVVNITNSENWITREGADIEDIESLRSRTLNSFAELATHPTRDKYKSVCEAVNGVLHINVDDQHPR